MPVIREFITEDKVMAVVSAYNIFKVLNIQESINYACDSFIAYIKYIQAGIPLLYLSTKMIIQTNKFSRYKNNL